MDLLLWQSYLDKEYKNFKIKGQGAFAKVYQATEISTNQLVAIKVIPKRSTYDQAILRLFQTECQYLDELQGMNIVKLFKIMQKTDYTFIITEYCECDLFQFQSKIIGHQSPLPLATAIDFVLQVSKALKVIHDKKLIHRDIKPNNILLKFKNAQDFENLVGQNSTEEKFKQVDFLLRSQLLTIKVADLGLMRSCQQTMIMSRAGSSGFMAPEIAQNQSYGKSADIYSLFKMFMMLLTGQQDEVNTMNDQKLRLMIKDESLFLLISRGLANDQKQRPSIQEVLDCLENQTKKAIRKQKIRFEELEPQSEQPNQPINGLLQRKVGNIRMISQQKKSRVVLQSLQQANPESINDDSLNEFINSLERDYRLLDAINNLFLVIQKLDVIDPVLVVNIASWIHKSIEEQRQDINQFTQQFSQQSNQERSSYFKQKLEEIFEFEAKFSPTNYINEYLNKYQQREQLQIYDILENIQNILRRLLIDQPQDIFHLALKKVQNVQKELELN